MFKATCALVAVLALTGCASNTEPAAITPTLTAADAWFIEESWLNMRADADIDELLDAAERSCALYAKGVPAYQQRLFDGEHAAHDSWVVATNAASVYCY